MVCIVVCIGGMLNTCQPILTGMGCLVQISNGIELEAVGRQFESYRWRPCGVTWDLGPEQSW